MRVCIGGTFNLLHRGHKSLINKALELAGEHGHVFIGITIGKMLRGKKDVKPFLQRKKAIEQYVSEKQSSTHVEIKTIKDRHGPSIEREFDAIVVTAETRSTAEGINKKRKQIARKPLEIVEIPFVLADDGVPISSTRIRNKEIDEEGRVLDGD